MLAMPLPTLIGSVPLDGERPDGVDVPSTAHRAVGAHPDVALDVLVRADAFEVAERVVLHVAISVVDVIAERDRAVCRLPDPAGLVACRGRVHTVSL